MTSAFKRKQPIHNLNIRSSALPKIGKDFCLFFLFSVVEKLFCTTENSIFSDSICRNKKGVFNSPFFDLGAMTFDVSIIFKAGENDKKDSIIVLPCYSLISINLWDFLMTWQWHGDRRLNFTKTKIILSSTASELNQNWCLVTFIPFKKLNPQISLCIDAVLLGLLLRYIIWFFFDRFKLLNAKKSPDRIETKITQ